MAVSEAVFCETPGVTVSGTTEAERKAEGRLAPAAELEGALKVIRAVGEQLTERMNQVRPRLQRLEHRFHEAKARGLVVDGPLCEELSHIRRITDEVCDQLQKFARVETLCVRTTPIGDILDLDESAKPDGGQ
jgi:hypothetical protein